MRQDLSQALPGHNQSMEFTPIDDFSDGEPRSGLDVMLVCKKWLADQSYSHVIALFPADQVSAMAQYLNPGPKDLAQKRPIGLQIQKNLRAYAPRCKASGDISEDAETFLLQWCEGQLPSLPPLALHALLTYKCPGVSFPLATATWEPPTRQRHIKFQVSGETNIQDEGDESDPDEALPITLDG